MDTIVQRLQKRVHAQASSDAGIATANSKQSSTHAMHGNLSPVQLWIGASPNTRTGLLVQQRACAAKGLCSKGDVIQSRVYSLGNPSML